MRCTAPRRRAAYACAATLLFLPSAAFALGSFFSDALAAKGALGIDVESARALEAKLGQLLIVNVDGFGYDGPLAVTPEFITMVETLQVGGVIPHYGCFDYEKIRRTNAALADLTALPLLVCADIVTLERKASNTARPPVARFGDGYTGGFIGKFRTLTDADFRTLASLNAFVLAAAGINVALGPTIDDSTGDTRVGERARMITGELRRFGVQPVIKHFPFLPKGADLHKESPDTRAPLETVEMRAGAFRRLRGESDILMTTHVFDSLVDEKSLVTFSHAWHKLLGRVSGFGGLVMTDGLLMLRNYRDAPAIPRTVRTAGLDGPPAWASAALLAGHDLLIVEGSAAVTYRVFEALLRAACGATETGRLLRARIEESYRRIARFKESKKTVLTRRLDVPKEAVQAVVALTPVEGELSRFSFDSGALARLTPEMERAAAPRSLFDRIFRRVP